MADKYPALKRFILPEKEISLKLVFDNARNYVIVGAFIAMARWFASGKVHVPALFFGDANDSYERIVFTLLCVAIGGVLFILNVAQSAGIVNRLLDALPVESESVQAIQAKHSLTKSTLEQLLALCAYAIVVIFIIVSVRMAIYIVWFSAVGSGR